MLAKQQLQTVHQQELLYNNIETQEIERKRIAQDLHDEIGTALSVIRLNLNQVIWHTANKRIREQYTTSTIVLVDKATENIRRISYRLLPETLEILGLYKTLESFCFSLQNASDIEVEFIAPVETPVLPSNVELGLYRICSELINNSIKHSGCKKITLNIQIIGDVLYIKYTDNGKGYNPNSEKVRRGLGVRNIISRTQMINAEIHFQQANPKGFEAILQMHLNTYNETA